MQISGLNMDYGYNGKVIVTIWCKCHSPEDVDEMIAWLKMAKANMQTWAQIDAQARPKKEGKDG